MVTIPLCSLEKLTTLGSKLVISTRLLVKQESQYPHTPVRAGVIRKLFTKMNPSTSIDSVSSFALGDCYQAVSAWCRFTTVCTHLYLPTMQLAANICFFVSII